MNEGSARIKVKKGRTAPFLTGALVMSAGLVVLAAVGEVMVRVYESSREQPEVETVNRSSGANKSDIRFRWRGNVGSPIEFDVTHDISYLGYNTDVPAMEKPEDVYRIFILGDSFVEAFQVPRSASIARQLEDLLNADSSEGVRFEVIGLARSGRGTWYQIYAYDRLAKHFCPDLVISTYFPFFLPRNDSSFKNTIVRSDSVRTARHNRRHSSVTLASSSMLNQIVADRIDRFAETWGHLVSRDYLPPEYRIYCPSLWDDDIEHAFAESRRLHEALAAYVTANGSEILFANFPNRWEARLSTLMWTPAMKSAGMDRSAMLGRVFPEEADVIDTYEVFLDDFKETGESHNFAVDGHWNARGHRVAAASLKEAILEKVGRRRTCEHVSLLANHPGRFETNGPLPKAVYRHHGDAVLFRLPQDNPSAGDFASYTLTVDSGPAGMLKGLVLDQSHSGDFLGRLDFLLSVNGQTRWSRDVYEPPNGLWQPLQVPISLADYPLEIRFGIRPRRTLKPWGFGHYTHTGLALAHIVPHPGAQGTQP